MNCAAAVSERPHKRQKEIFLLQRTDDQVKRKEQLYSNWRETCRLGFGEDVCPCHEFQNCPQNRAVEMKLEGIGKRELVGWSQAKEKHCLKRGVKCGMSKRKQ